MVLIISLPHWHLAPVCFLHVAAGHEELYCSCYPGRCFLSILFLGIFLTMTPFLVSDAVNHQWNETIVTAKTPHGCAVTSPTGHPEHQQFYRQNFDLLYTRIAAAQESAREVLSEEFEIQVQHPALIPLLRPYQEQGVRWMLGRERQPLQHSGENNLLATLTDRHGKVVHFNTVGGLWVVSCCREHSHLPDPFSYFMSQAGLWRHSCLVTATKYIIWNVYHKKPIINASIICRDFVCL